MISLPKYACDVVVLGEFLSAWIYPKQNFACGSKNDFWQCMCLKHWTQYLNPCSQNFMINDQHAVTEDTSCHGNPVAHSTHFPKGNRQKRTVLWIILTKQLYCQSNCSWIITITTNRNTLTNHTADHCLQVCYVQGMLGMWIPPSGPLFILPHQAEPQESTNTQTNKQLTL